MRQERQQQHQHQQQQQPKDPRRGRSILFPAAMSSTAIYGLLLLLSVIIWRCGAQQQQQPRPNDPDLDLTTCVPVGILSQFKITLINMGSIDDTEERFVTALEKAVGRWQKIIINDVQPDFATGTVDDWFLGQFDRPYNGPVDDVVIGYDLSNTIDGPGGVLGSGGATFTRINRSTGRATSTIAGVMKFDVTDLRMMPDGDFKAVALHEMGHVLGLVSSNGACSAACDPGNGREQGRYECPLASRLYREMVATLATTTTATKDALFLENRGGIGTACGHWEEDSFQTGDSSEIMTGFFEANLFQPVSRVTVAALHEIGGYEVDYCGADIWPADENTIQRYEVYKTENGIDIETTMGSPPTMMGMDDTGRPVPLFFGPDKTFLNSRRAVILWVILSVVSAFVVLFWFMRRRRRRN